MGHSKLNLAVVIVGAFTMGAAFVASENKAEAYTECSPTVIVADPISACTEFSIDPITLTASCFDDGQYYDSDHYMVLPDEDAEGFYLGVWE